jgi:hypothetical protein
MPNYVYPFDPDMPYDERASRQIKLLKAGVLGPPNGRPSSDHEVQEIYFDVVARSAETGSLDRPMTVQWKFADAEPWHVRLDNGSTAALPGLAPDPDVTLETNWGDWIDISMRGANFGKAVLARRLRPRGSLGSLRRMRQVWVPRSSPVT